MSFRHSAHRAFTIAEPRDVAASGAALLDIVGGTDSRGARLGGLVELFTPRGAVSDVVVTLDTLGAGENVEGRPTRRYRITTHFSLALTSRAGQLATAQGTSVTDFWQADAERIPNPFTGLDEDDSPDDFLAPLSRALVQT